MAPTSDASQPPNPVDNLRSELYSMKSISEALGHLTAFKAALPDSRPRTCTIVHDTKANDNEIYNVVSASDI